MAHVARIPAWQWFPLFQWRAVATVEAVNDIPARLPRHGAIIVGTLRRPKWIAFDCPCRRGHRILLNGDPARAPQWRVLQIDPLSLHPSIDFDDGQSHCHFIITRGHVWWVDDP